MLKFLIFNPILPFKLLNVTKSLDKISQFEFLVMTEKNVYFFVKIAPHPPRKDHPPSFLPAPL